MKLFDQNEEERRTVRRLMLWHLGYIALVALFFSIIYYWGLFKAHPLLRESPLFIIISPLTTALFVMVSPWRGRWRQALQSTYRRLGGELVFCLMGALVLGVGFFLYSVLLWGLGALGPSLFYM